MPPQAVLLKMTMGMWVAQALGVAGRLGIADQIAAGKADADAIADAVGASREGIYRLTRALASVGVFREVAPRTFANTPLGEALRRDVPGSMRDFVVAETRPAHWLPWGRLEDAVRTASPQTKAAIGCEIWEHYARQPDEGGEFSRAMGNLSSMAGMAVLAEFDVTPFTSIVDVGGAHGDFVAQALQANPKARGTVFDLPGIAEGAKASLSARGLAGRCDTVGGSFFETVPSGGDLYLLKHILHDWSDAESKQILTRVREAMQAGGGKGTLLIVEFVIPDDDSPSPAKLLDLNMMVMLTGRERTAPEYEALLRSAGLRMERVVRTDSPVSAIVAVPG
jgi:hypothetical protein